MRLQNRIVHGYWSIDLEVLHTTATEQLPAFTADLRSVLNTLTEGTWPGRRANSRRCLIRDRAGQFTDTFDAVFAAAGIRILLSSPQHRANVICERMIGTLRREVLDRMLIINERHLNPRERVR